MTKKLKLADVLWDAANQELSSSGSWADDKSVYSCTAVQEHVYMRLATISWLVDPELRARQEWASREAGDRSIDFLKQLGCPVGRSNLIFGQPSGHRRQGVRYMWLLLAMHVAEDEGIEL